ncbi:MAG TPA: dTMP kinase [Clostridiaceae bacterium]|jgi:dTMP kinase|nr:dTMP kinase [Clostridiaceae bacterium]
MGKGIFITCEGLDGSGKSTQINLIYDFFIKMGYKVVLTREPGGTVISEKIRDVLLDVSNLKMGQLTEMLLYAASRAQLVFEVVKPAIEEGKIVICDRFVDSSYVYQGFGRGIDLATIIRINEIAMDSIRPDITFFFDVEPEVALGRIKAQDKDRIENESIDFHRRVYKGYLALAEKYPERIKVINGNRKVDDIFSDVKTYLVKLTGACK